MDGVPRREDGDGRKQRRQQHQPQADAVHAQEIVDAPLRHPCCAIHQLRACLTGRKTQQQPQRHDEGENRDAKSHPLARLFFVARHQQQDRDADEWKESNECQQWKTQLIHARPLSNDEGRTTNWANFHHSLFVYLSAKYATMMTTPNSTDSA